MCHESKWRNIGRTAEKQMAAWYKGRGQRYLEQFEDDDNDDIYGRDPYDVCVQAKRKFAARRC